MCFVERGLQMCRKNAPPAENKLVWKKSLEKNHHHPPFSFLPPLFFFFAFQNFSKVGPPLTKIPGSAPVIFFYTPVFRRDVLWYGDVRPSDSPSGSPSARFPHFSHTCFDILSWNFAHDFVLMYYRSSSSVVTLPQFLKELYLFVNLEYR